MKIFRYMSGITGPVTVTHLTGADVLIADSQATRGNWCHCPDFSKQ